MGRSAHSRIIRGRNPARRRSYNAAVIPAPTAQRVPGAGVELVTYDWGGSGAPVLLAHPTGFHGRVWAPIAQRLVAAGRHVWSFDFRGHGDSEAPDTEYSWHEFGDDVFAVARQLDLVGDPTLLAVGHSKGAAALLLAEEKEEGTFSTIWAYEPVMFATLDPLPPQEDFFLARAARKRRNEWTSVDDAYAAYASKPPLNVLTPETLRAYVEFGLRDRGDGILELKCTPEIEARIYSMGPNHGAFARLDEVAARVLVVCGGSSTDIGPPLAAQIAERIPNGHLEVMTDLAHFGPLQDPDAAVASILRFARG
jgi:pimeloyl-ACP methyl ester carboxylesterase